MIYLSVGRIDIDWGKNANFANHLDLFQEGDEGANDYYYVAMNGDPIVESQVCLGRNLSRVRPRLDMLGYTLSWVGTQLDEYFGDDVDMPISALDSLKQVLRTIDWINGESNTDFDEVMQGAFIRASECDALASVNDRCILPYGMYFDPYLVLRVLAEIDEYSDLRVSWKFADVLEGGYVDASCFEVSAPNKKWIVVTEGSSDTFILQCALHKIYPDIADFFDFIDMSGGNPFPGVGNLVAFCKGLSRIRYSGNMLLVLDNDTAGRRAQLEIQALGLPASVIVTCLPELEQLRRFKTLGPAGENIENINGRASAVECFLDFSNSKASLAVRWTSFVPQLQQYQGELVGKDSFITDFKKRAMKDEAYDWSKLQLLWNYLITRCAEAASFIESPALK